MVNTKKFSEFSEADLAETDNEVVGLSNGANARSAKVIIWTTMTRPTPPSQGLLGYNTDLDLYEFYNGALADWESIPGTGDIDALIARLAAHTMGDGASMIGLLNQSGVTDKTVQDLANSKSIVQQNNGAMQNAQALGDLTTGILKSTTVTGVVSISAPLTSIDGLTTAADEMLYTTGVNTYAVTPFTTLARTLVGNSTEEEMRTTIGIAPLTDGQLIIGSTGLDPVLTTLTAGTGINIINAPGSITIESIATGGTVTSVGTNNGLTGGTITTTGTLGLASIADLNILANISGGATFPGAHTLSSVIDASMGSAQGDILYRNASGWVVLAPGTSGEFLQTLGAGANPVWAPGDGAGTVTSITAGTGLTGGVITSSGTIALDIPVTVVHGGTGLTSTTINQILYSSANNTIAELATANNGILVTSSGGVPSIGFVIPSAVIIASNLIKTIKTQIFNAGSSTYTPSTGMLFCQASICSGGAGGGGASGTAGQCMGGGGGGAGGAASKLYTAAQIGATAAVVVGAGGAGGTAGANAGSSGNASSFTPAGAGATLSCGAPTGGAGGTQTATANNANGGAGGTATGGDQNIIGEAGTQGFTFNGAASFAFGGNGGSPGLGFGVGGINPSNISAGVAGRGAGAGGSGGTSGLGANVAGGAGVDGICIVNEYCNQ